MVKTLWFLPAGLILLIAGFLSISYRSSVNLGSYLSSDPVHNSSNTVSKLHLYFKVTPAIAHDNISVEYCVDGAAHIDLKLLDANGQFVDQLMDRNVGNGFFQTTFDVSEKYFPGIYYIVMNRNGKKMAKKIRITS